MLSAVHTLSKINYTLYGSKGTAEFYGKKGIPVS